MGRTYIHPAAENSSIDWIGNVTTSHHVGITQREFVSTNSDFATDPLQIPATVLPSRVDLGFDFAVENCGDLLRRLAD
jgi:hypothetical protein